MYIGTDRAMATLNRLKQDVPSIGILNQRRRIRAYLAVTARLQGMLQRHTLTEREALFVLSALSGGHRRFRKAAETAAAHLYEIPGASISAIGLTFANEIRRHRGATVQTPEETGG